MPALTAERQVVQPPRGSRNDHRHRHAVDARLVDNATADYLRGRISLEDYTRLVESYFRTIDESMRVGSPSLAIDHFIVTLARWLKHPRGRYVR